MDPKHGIINGLLCTFNLPHQDDEFLEKATDLLTAEVLGQLENSNWKERLAGMEKFTQLVKSMSPNEVPCQICVRAVNKKPGLKETNFQVRNEPRHKKTCLLGL